MTTKDLNRIAETAEQAQAQQQEAEAEAETTTH